MSDVKISLLIGRMLCVSAFGGGVARNLAHTHLEFPDSFGGIGSSLSESKDPVSALCGVRGFQSRPTCDSLCDCQESEKEVPRLCTGFDGGGGLPRRSIFLHLRSSLGRMKAVCPARDVGRACKSVNMRKR